jgi:hypothetical protein
MISIFWLLVCLLGWLTVSLIGRVVFKKLVPQHIQRKIERYHDHD